MINREDEIRKYARRATALKLLRLAMLGGVVFGIVLVVRQGAFFIERWTSVASVQLDRRTDTVIPPPPPQADGDTPSTEPGVTSTTAPATEPAEPMQPTKPPGAPAEPLPTEPPPAQPRLPLDVAVSSPLWSEAYEPKYPIPFASSSTRNYLTVTITASNPTADASSAPAVMLVDANGAEIEGFGPSRDATDYPPGSALPAGKSCEGFWTFPTGEAKHPLQLRFTAGDAVRLVRLKD